MQWKITIFDHYLGTYRSLEWCHFRWHWMTPTQIVSSTRHYSTLNISERLQDEDGNIVIILIGTYTRPTERCNVMTLSDLQWHQHFQREGASRGLSATAELLVACCSVVFVDLLRATSIASVEKNDNTGLRSSQHRRRVHTAYWTVARMTIHNFYG